ncbi:hypothetical protein [Carboxylicivirga sp. N1Y90]|uniref:hypothetical protein n=1 Tax=Carboxylicivirga fragile TaxID=3417571 RepID=UPI003D349F15|nr:hypothetical protein [Marinilabiliaceae bacterium N1Y90]
MHYTKHTITSFIHQADTIVKNGKQVDAIRNAVVKYGYDEQQMSAGEILVKELREIQIAQHEAKSEKVRNYKRKQNLQAQVHKLYMKYVKLGRIAFVNDVRARKALVLDGGRERTYNEWLYQVTAFCSIMLGNDNDYLEVMARFGVTKLDFEDLKKQLKELNKVSDLCLKSMGEVRELTAQRKRKVLEMQQYVSDFLKVARIALEYSPKLLESLGVAVKS